MVELFYERLRPPPTTHRKTTGPKGKIKWRRLSLSVTENSVANMNSTLSLILLLLCNPHAQGGSKASSKKKKKKRNYYDGSIRAKYNGMNGGGGGGDGGGGGNGGNGNGFGGVSGAKVRQMRTTIQYIISSA